MIANMLNNVTLLDDPILWLRTARILMFAIAAVIMLWEPFTCGGVNRLFHRLLAGLFAGSAIWHHSIASARADVLMNFPDALVGLNMLWAELGITIMLGIVIFDMAYQIFVWRAYNSVTPQVRAVHSCRHRFQP